MPSFDGSANQTQVAELARGVSIAHVSRDATKTTMREAAQWLATKLDVVGGLAEGMDAWESLWRLLADGEHRLPSLRTP